MSNMTVTQVETFEVEVERHPEASEEALRLIESLDLDGQRAACTAEGTRAPYRVMNNVEFEVYSLLCPTREPVEQYRAEPIPLRVLTVLEHAKSLGIYEGFEVWHDANPAVKDPVLTAWLPGDKYRTERRLILARWGAELDALPTLVMKAAQVKAARTVATARTLKAQAEAIIATLTASVQDSLDQPTISGYATFR